MSTTIRGNSEEPAVAIKKSISNSSPSTSINYKNGLAVAAVTAVSSPLKKQQQGVCDKKNDTKQQMLKTLNSHNSNCKSESNNNNSTTNINSSSSLGGGTAKTLPSITTTKSLSSSSLPNNSYSLDFLHSVGVKMTGATMRSSQGTPYAYAGDNQFPLSSQVHNNSSYANGMSTDHQRQQRYVYGPNNNNNTSTGNGGGGSIGSGHHHYHQQQHYYHHQPKQLTIASFLKNDLLLETVNSSGVGGGRYNGNSSTARNTKNYNNDQQQQRTSHNQRYHHSCYTSSPYHQRQQHQNQPLIMSHTNYMSSGCAARKLNYTGDMNRLLGSSTGNGGVVGSTGQRSCVSYPGYHNFVSSDEVGISRTNSIQSTIFPSQQQQSNAENASAPLSNNTSVNNKRSYASSTASSCSTASSKSLSSNSSKNSGRQFASYKPSVIKQKSVKNSTNLNLVIETLPAKSFVGHGSNQRVSHNRGQHHIYNNRRQHHYSLNSGGAGGGGGSANHHHNQHLLISSPNLLQHQNYYNLKYVSTDGFVSSGGTTSRGCSPPPPPVVPASTAATNHSPKTVESSPAGTVAMLMSFNTNELQYPRYSTAHHLADQHQQFYQYQQQHVQQNFLNKKLMSPLTLTMPSLSHSLTSACNTSAVSLNAREQPTPTSAAVLQNIISSSKLDKVVATATSSPTSTIIANNNYDSDSSLNHSCTPQTNEYNSLKSSLSLSSTTSSSCVTSASTGSSLTQQNFSQPATPSSVGAPRTLLQSPLNCNYSRGGGGMDMQQHTFTEIQDYHRAEQQQHNTHQLNNSEKKVIQEFPQIYQNISEDHDSTLLNLPAQLPDNFSGNECQNQKQQQYQQQQQPPQQHEFYFNSAASNDYINAAASLVTNRSNINCNYWNPLYHGSQLLHRNFASAQMALLPPPPLPVTSSLPSSCGSSSASMSPMLHSNSDHILTEGGIGMQQQQHLHKNIIATAASSSSSSSPSSNNLNEQFCHLVIDTNNFGNDSGLVVGVGAAVAPSSCNSNSSNSTTAGSTCGSNGSGNSINSINVGSDHKWGSSQLLMQQHQHFIAQQQQQNTHQGSSSFTSASTLTNTVRVRGGCTCNTNNNQIQKQADSSTITSNVVSANGGSHLQQQPTQHLYTRHQQQQKSLPTPPPLPPPHNQLFNNPPTHHLMRALSSSLSITQSVYDFAHTPPDRFLARAHLTEVKETPPTLLNKTKWDNLSQSIWTKFVTSQQTGETFKQKMLLWRYLFIYIKNSPFARFGIYLVGSTISGFGSDSSDVDMCLVSRITPHVEPRSEALYTLTSLREWLSKSGEFEHFNLIEAKVPILRFRDRLNQFEIDLNYNNCVGISNTHLLYCYSQLDWRLRPLVLVTKLWAQYHNINNAKNMTISSYSLVLMVIHFLQYAVDPPVLPCLHKKHPDKFQPLRSNEFNHVDMNETIGGYESKNSQTIGELFLYFLRYYSCFDYTQYAISVRTGGVLPIDSCRKVKSLKNDIHQWKELCIEEPFDYTNTARSVYDYKTFERVKGVFIASWHILEETLDLNSVFSPITLSPLTAAVNGSDGCECEATTFESSNTTATAITITTAVVNANTVVSPQLYTTVNPSLSKDFSFTSISGNYENNNSLNDKSSMDVTNVNRCSDADNDDVKDNYTAKTTNNLQVSKCKDHNTITRCAGDSKEYQQQMIKQKEKVQKQQQLPSSYNLVSSLNSLNYIKSNTKNKCNKNSTATDASKIS